MSNFASFIKKYSDVFKAIVVLTVVCLVISAALAFTNDITKDKIAEIEKASASAAMEALIPDAVYTQADLTDVLGTENAEIYTVTDKDTTVGYIITTAAKGYGGDVTVMTAVSTDKKIIGVNILSAADETPGLGQNVTKEDFYIQYKDKHEGITVVKNGAKDNEINAVTGATITSRAVTNAINDAFAALNTYLSYLEPIDASPVTVTTDVEVQ